MSVSKYQKVKRVEAVLDLMIMGLSTKEIRETALGEEAAGGYGWKITERTLENYIAAASKLLIEASKKSQEQREAQLGLAIARLNDLYSRNMTIQDYKAALATQKELNVLHGFRKKHEIHDLNVNSPETFEGWVAFHSQKQDD